jgi:hypothetical protein
VEKELITLGEPRAARGGQDIFRHCRGFERAFQVMLNEADVAFKIRAVVEGTLPETLARIPIERRFNKHYAREICREADGYQPHLVSPERGIKRLVAEAMALTSDHVHRFVDEIHLVLMDTVREAARRSVAAEHAPPASGAPGALGGAAKKPELDYLRLRGFENAVITAATQALEEWRAEAHKVAAMMVAMECDYVTPSFFRDLERRWQEEAAGGAGPGRDRMDALAAGEVPYGEEEEEDDDGESAADGGAPGAGSPPGARGAAPPPAGAPAPPLRADLRAGWLEKRAGDSSSLASLPVESWRWQRRWFVLAVDAGFLYYFKSPEEMSNPKASPSISINLRECVVEDFHPEAGGLPPSRRSSQRLPGAAGDAGAVSLLIRVSHRNAALPVAKGRHSLVLRAGDATEKFDWLARLRLATEGAPRAPPRAGQLAGGGGGPAGAPRAPLSPAASGRAADESRGLFGRSLTKVTDGFARMTGLGASRLGDPTAAGSIEDLDAYYERLGTFTGLYARSVFDRMARTVPKAIILCQVIRSRDRLLDQLFNYVAALSPREVEFLLAEDPEATRRRAAAAQASKDLFEAAEEVRRAQEARAGDPAGAGRMEAWPVSVRALLLAGAFPLVPRDRVPTGVNPAAPYGEFTPLTLAEKGPLTLGPKAGARPASPDEGAAGGGAGAPAAAAGAPAAASASAKPRRQPPPPPPK